MNETIFVRNEWLLLISLIAAAFLVVVFCSPDDNSKTESDVRVEAVERGYAEWTTDRSGKRQFRWKE